MVVKQFQDGGRPPILKIIISPYLSEKSSDFDDILYTAAEFEQDECHVIKKEKVALDRLWVQRMRMLFRGWPIMVNDTHTRRRRWVSILWGVKICHLPLTWLVAVNTVLALPRSLWSVCLYDVPLLPPLGHIWDVMFVWRKGNINKNCLCVVCTIIMTSAQRYEQFLQVGQLYRALILLGLALFQAPLCLHSSWCYIDIKFFLLTSFSLPFSELSVVGLVLDLVD